MSLFSTIFTQVNIGLAVDFSKGKGLAKGDSEASMPRVTHRHVWRGPTIGARELDGRTTELGQLSSLHSICQTASEQLP